MDSQKLAPNNGNRSEEVKDKCRDKKLKSIKSKIDTGRYFINTRELTKALILSY